MKTTYIIENAEGEILQYFHRLSDAKYDLIKQFNNNRCSILCMKGPSFGEGWHQYRIEWTGSKWQRTETDFSKWISKIVDKRSRIFKRHQ